MRIKKSLLEATKDKPKKEAVESQFENHASVSNNNKIAVEKARIELQKAKEIESKKVDYVWMISDDRRTQKFVKKENVQANLENGFKLLKNV